MPAIKTVTNVTGLGDPISSLIHRSIELEMITSGSSNILITGNIVINPTTSAREITKDRGIRINRLFPTNGGNRFDICEKALTMKKLAILAI
jgi:hypothetical protein